MDEELKKKLEELYEMAKEQKDVRVALDVLDRWKLWGDESG